MVVRRVHHADGLVGSRMLHHRQRILLKSKDGKSRGVVDAEVYTNIAIHKSLSVGRYYQITHLKSFEDLGKYASREKAVNAAQALMFSAVDLSVERLNDEDMKKIYDITRPYRAG